MRLAFLGTGASGGTPGDARSRRRESSVLVAGATTRVLVDATRDLDAQLAAEEPARLDAVLLTHGHRDASGGVQVLGKRRHPEDALPVYAHAQTHETLRHRRGPKLVGVELVDVAAGDRLHLGDMQATPVEVPHAKSPRFPTFAWHLETERHRVVYASDVAELTGELETLSRGSDLLILDGAMYGRSIFTHLRIEQAVPSVCEWDVRFVLLTQIGRTAPPHEELTGIVQALCRRAAPAFDGLRVDLDASDWWRRR